MRTRTFLMVVFLAGCGSSGGGGGGGGGTVPVTPPPASSATIALPSGGVATTSGTVVIDATIANAASIAWSAVDGPALPVITADAGEDPTVQVPLAGTYRVRVIATDAAGRATEALCTITASGGWRLAGDVSDGGNGRSGLAIGVDWTPSGGRVLTLPTGAGGAFARDGLLGPPDDFIVIVPGG